MAPSTLKDSQMQMARYLRDPAKEPPPAGVERRRLKIYEDLIYNNIEGFLSGGFPVLRSLYRDADWHSLVRLFIDQHRCHTPYFLEISQEFLTFLMEAFEARACDPPFMAELAHYEWAELVLDVSEETLPESVAYSDILDVVPGLSPLAWSLCYQFPVHRIGTGFTPSAAEDPTYLVVYRDREDQVRFMELNAAVARLLELIRDNDTSSTRELLAALALEMKVPAESILLFGCDQVQQLIDQTVVLVTDSAGCG